MKFLLYVFLGWTVLVLQSTVVSYAMAGWPQPDLLLVLMIFLGLTCSMAQGLPIALAYGYLLDLFVGGIPGAYLFQYAVLYSIAHLLRGRLLPTAMVVQVLVVFSFTLLGDGLLGMSAKVLGLSQAAVGAGGLSVIFRGVVNALIAAFLYPALMGLERRLWPRAGRITLAAK